MLRGRCSCAISGRPTPSPAFQSPAKSFVSPTSKKFARKSFVSPTYAKTGGWGGVSLFAFCSPLPRILCYAFFLCRLIFLATSHSSLTTNSNHSRTIGNCCPTSRTRSNIYHYIKYPCRRADIPISALDEKQRKSTGKNACATDGRMAARYLLCALGKASARRAMPRSCLRCMMKCATRPRGAASHCGRPKG